MQGPQGCLPGMPLRLLAQMAISAMQDSAVMPVPPFDHPLQMNSMLIKVNFQETCMLLQHSTNTTERHYR